MTLPEPARTLLLQGWPALEKAAERIGMSTGDMLLGGGTVLAGRWSHRRSFDLDFCTEPGTPLHLLHGELDRGPMRDAGWEILYSPRAGKLLALAPAGEAAANEETERGRIEIWNNAPVPEQGATTTEIEGYRITTLSTTQILRGKMQRAMYCVPRDLVDFATAGALDAQSLEHAINQWPREATRNVARVWDRTMKGWTGRQWREVETAVRGSRQTAETTVKRASSAILDAVYESLKIDKTGRNTLTVRTVTANGAERTTVVEATEFEWFLETSGFARRFGARRTASLTAQATTAREGAGLYEEERGRETAVPRPTPPPQRPPGTSRRAGGRKPA